MYQAPTTVAPVDSIIARLRPRTVGEILDRAFRLYRRHFLTFIAIIAVLHVPLQLVRHVSPAVLSDFVGSAMSYDPASSYGTLAYFGVAEAVILLTFLICSLIEQLSQGALTAAVTDNYLDRPVSFGSAYRVILPHMWRLLGLMLLQLSIMILAFVPAILFFGLGILASLDMTLRYNGPATALACLSFLLLIPGFAVLIYMLCRLSVAVPALIVENLGPVEAIRRSWRLVEGYWWRTFGLQVLLIVLWLAVSVGLAMLVLWMLSFVIPEDFALQEAISIIVSILATLLYVPLQVVATALYYFELRVRKEGYDLEAAMDRRYPIGPTPEWAAEATAASLSSTRARTSIRRVIWTQTNEIVPRSERE
jgi:hypothetical protein